MIWLGWVRHFVGLKIWFGGRVGWIDHFVGFHSCLGWRFGWIGLGSFEMDKLLDW